MGLPTQVSPPQIALSDVAPSAVIGADAVAVPVLADPDHGPTLGPGAAELVDELGEDLFALLDAASATGEAGEVVERVVLDTAGLTNPDLRLVLLVGVGSGGTDDLRRAGAALARHARGRLTVATSLGALGDDAALRALVEGLVLGSFEFHWRSTGPVEQPVERVVLAGMADADSRAETVAKALAVAGAGWLSRTLALVPSNVKHPAWMAEQAADVAQRAGLGIKVWDEEQLAKQGFGGIVGVGQASANPPRLVRLDYAPKRGGRKAPHVVLVGKGITFDTGGLSIKSPRQHDADEARHDRRRRGAGRDGGARRPRLPGAGDRAAAAGRELRRRQLDPPRRRAAALRRPDHGGHQHRRRGPAGARGRDGVRRRRARARTPWSTSPPSPGP